MNSNIHTCWYPLQPHDDESPNGFYSIVSVNSSERFNKKSQLCYDKTMF